MRQKGKSRSFNKFETGKMVETSKNYCIKLERKNAKIINIYILSNLKKKIILTWLSVNSNCGLLAVVEGVVHWVVGVGQGHVGWT